MTNLNFLTGPMFGLGIQRRKRKIYFSYVSVFVGQQTDVWILNSINFESAIAVSESNSELPSSKPLVAPMSDDLADTSRTIPTLNSSKEIREDVFSTKTVWHPRNIHTKLNATRDVKHDIG